MSANFIDPGNGHPNQRNEAESRVSTAGCPVPGVAVQSCRVGLCLVLLRCPLVTEGVPFLTKIMRATPLRSVACIIPIVISTPTAQALLHCRITPLRMHGRLPDPITRAAICCSLTASPSRVPAHNPACPFPPGAHAHPSPLGANTVCTAGRCRNVDPGSRRFGRDG